MIFKDFFKQFAKGPKASEWVESAGVCAVGFRFHPLKSSVMATCGDSEVGIADSTDTDDTNQSLKS